MAKRPNIALLIERSNAYARGVMRGIYSYMRDHQLWSIYLADQGLGNSPPDWLKNWHGEGIIARIITPQIAKAVLAMKAPSVDVSGSRLAPSLLCVETDNRAVARMAVEHLTQRGFKNLAFCGIDHFAWSRERCHWFTHFAEQAGCSLTTLPAATSSGKSSVSWQQEDIKLGEWLRGLRKPCGVMACNDLRGWQVLEACRRVEVAVPDELAVIGVDNDELLCNLTDPPLSSIICDTLRIGYETAESLDAMMRGQTIADMLRLIEPLGVCTRPSSDVLAIADSAVSTAVRYIREHAINGIKVENLLSVVPMSRSILESRFKKALGRTPHEEILRVQLQRVKQLLEETDMSLAEIAPRAGFKHPEYLSVAFKREEGVSPGDYRSKRLKYLQ